MKLNYLSPHQDTHKQSLCSSSLSTEPLTCLLAYMKLTCAILFSHLLQTSGPPSHLEQIRLLFSAITTTIIQFPKSFTFLNIGTISSAPECSPESTPASDKSPVES